ncbi:DUF2510 domain-containing protein [Microbacterium terregens]|uniref:DUF2510 domain-containing protein n=1 Tax=Microbacterium terregens TaxID=69363 RepID=A0ABV5T1C1_9MICO
MSERTPGWYPNPDPNGGIRWWNGSEWTENQPTQTAPVGQFSIPGEPLNAVDPKSRRRLVIASIAVGGVLLVGAGIAVGASLLAGDNGALTAATPSASRESVERTTPAAAPPRPTPEAPPAPTLIAVGQTLESQNFHLTVNSAQVLERIETTDGAPLTPAAGTQLVLVKTTYTVTGPNAVDLTCGNYDTFIRGYDSDGGQMAETFETPRIPGNQPCNEKIVTGQTAEWNFAYQMTAGRQPGALVVIDTNFYGANAWGEEQLLSLR